MEAEKARKEAENKQKLFEEALAKAREELGLLSDDEPFYSSMRTLM